MMNNVDPFAETNLDNGFDFEGSEAAIPEVSEPELQTSLGSRTAPRGQYEQIASRRITWKSNKKAFESYNSESKESKIVPANIEFIPLTATVSVTGSRPMGKKGTPSEHYNNITSNEITDLNSELMIVKERDYYEDRTDEICKGYYSNSMTQADGSVLPPVKEVIANLPYANYTMNIYCVVRNTEDIVKFAFTKASRQAGFDINNNMTGKAFKLKEAVEVNNGGIVYYTPSIEFIDITPDEDAKATDIAIKVEEKLKRNKARVS